MESDLKDAGRGTLSRFIGEMMGRWMRIMEEFNQAVDGGAPDTVVENFRRKAKNIESDISAAYKLSSIRRDDVSEET